MARLSACLIVKDEAELLPDCLASLKGWVDEVVVVDTGSSDATVAIAEAAGARVLHQPWADDFSAPRNAAIEAATGAWILIIDADERLVVEDPQALEGILAGPVAAHAFRMVNEGFTEQSPHRVVRLFPRDAQLRYRGRIHEGIGHDLGLKGWPLRDAEGLHFVHLGYLSERVHARDKQARNLRLSRLDWAEHPDKAYAAFCYARSALSAGALNEAALAWGQLEGLLAQGQDADPYGPQYLGMLRAMGAEAAKRSPAEAHAALGALTGLSGSLLAATQAPSLPPSLTQGLLGLAVQLRPQDPEPWALAGQLAWAAEDQEGARQAWGEAVARDPGHWVAEPLRKLGGPLAPRVRLSACLIVKDEAEALPACLASLKGWVDELVVVDTGSSDATVAIAQAAGAVVGHFPWCDDFSAARNHALGLATGDWVLTIDADERLSVLDPKGLVAALEDSTAWAYLLPLENLDDQGRVASRLLSAPRLFRRDERIRYEGRLHEDVSPALARLGHPSKRLGAVLIQHLGYTEAILAAKDKLARNRRLAELQSQERPEDPNAWLQLAAIASRQGDHEAALPAVARARQSLQGGKALAPHRRASLSVIEAAALRAQGRPEAALASLNAAWAEGLASPELAYERGQALAQAGQRAEAQAAFEACLELSRRGAGEGTARAGLGGFLCHVELMALHLEGGDLAAGAHHAAAAAADPACPPEEAARLAVVAQQLARGAEAAASQAAPPSAPAPAVAPAAQAPAAAPASPARVPQPPAAPAPRAAAPELDPMESREAALAVLRQDERRPDGWLALAVHEREAQALDKALVATAQCLRLDAGLAMAWFFLGVIFAELGEPRLADQAMALVLRLDPEHPTAQAQRVALRAHPRPEHSTPELLALLAELEGLLNPKLSLCMIVKDESPRVARAIRSAAPWVDEIVVVDTGSTDGTVAIAEAEGARVLPFHWQRDFSAARNAAIEAATGDWILMLDADEVLVMASLEHLRRQLLDRSLAGLALSIVDVDPLGLPQGAESPSLRLFQRLPGLRYAGRLHESLAESLEALGLQVGETKALRLNHHGHQAKVVLEKDKALRNLELARLDHQDAPDDFRGAFKLAVAEAQAGQTVAALERLVALNEAQAGGIQSLPERLWAQVILVWAQVAWTAGDAIQAEDLMDQALERLPGFPPFLLTRGRLRAARWDLSSAAADFRACLGQDPEAWAGHAVLESLGDGPALAELARLGLGARPGEAAELGEAPPAAEAPPSPPATAASQLARLEAALPSKEEALALVAQDEQDTQAWLLLAFRCQEGGDAAGALEAVGEALRLDASAASAWITLAQALESLGLPRQAARAWQCLQQVQPDHPLAAAERTRLRGLGETAQMPEALAAWLEATLALVEVRVSACLIVKDEAERLGDCLEALAPWVDELVVVDTGSTDGTVAIAEAAGARVLHHPWQDDFAAARNLALEAAQHGWCLVVDADERLVVSDEAAWYAALRHRKALAYALTVEDLDEQGEVALRFGAVRLLQRHPQLRYSGRLHESVSPALQSLGATAQSLPTVRLRHDGHHTQAMLARGKAARNQRIAQREAAEQPESSEALLKLAASELGQVPAEASLAAFQALEAKGWAGLGAPTTAHAIGLQVRLMKDLGLDEGAEALLDTALKRFGAFPELHLERAASRAKRGALDLAAEDLRACLAGQGVDFGAFAVRQGATDLLPQAALRQLGLPEAGPVAPEARGGWQGGSLAERPSATAGGAAAQAGAAAVAEAKAPGPTSALAAPSDPLAEAKAALAQNPRDEQAWLALAWHSFQSEAFDKALVALHQHLLLQAGRPAGWALLGLTLSALGLPRWAERAWRLALQWDPEHPSARQQLQALREAVEAEEAPEELAATLEAMLALGQPRLSACLIVKNEEANLPRCLASLQGWADEVVVVDTGSTDGTVAIAEAFGAKVGHFPWTGDFAEARNASFALATGDWILVIDADEELEVPSTEAFRQALAFRVPAAYVAPLVNLDAEGQPMGEVALLRLVQRVPGLRMTGALHESFADAIHELGWPVMGSDDFRLRHHGYALGLEASQAKGRRNLEIAEAELARLGPSPERWLNLMRSAHLAGEGARAREALGALQALGGAAALVDVHLGLWSASAVQILREDGDLAGALALVEAALARLPEVADFWLARAELRQALGDVSGARADLEAVLGLAPHHLGIHPNPKGAAQAALAALRPAPSPAGPAGLAVSAPPPPASGELMSAAEAKAQLAEDPRDPIAWLALAFHSMQEGALDKALVALQQHLMVDASRPAAWALFGMCLADLGLPRWAERAWSLALAWDPEHPTARQHVVALRQQEEAEAPPPDMAERLEGMLALGRPRLSACLIVKNEAANLPRCLEALRPWVDEVVVVDTGSTDQTVAIAEAFGAKVGHFAWTGDFSAARNHSFGLASGDWLFVVDADEELVVEDPEGLRRLLAQRSPAAYALPLVNLGAQGQAEGRLHLLRLVQNLPGLRMTGALHENFAEAIQALGWPVWATEALHLLHHGYAQGAADLMAKGERNLGVAEEELTRLGPSAERLLNVARSALLAGARRRAGEAFAQIWSGGWAKALHNVHLVLLVGSHIHLLRGDGALEAALVVAEAGLARLPDLPDFLLERGALRRDLGDWPGAIADFEAAEALPRHLMTLRVDHVAEAQSALRALRHPLPNPRKLSACLIVKDEAATLARCLRALKPWVDEIVVVDTGSTDGTVAIAESFGAKVGHFPWCDDFSAARNHALSLATGHWALSVDADELLWVAEPEAWRQALGHPDPQVGAFVFPILNRQAEGGAVVSPMLRLFRLDERVRYEGRLHEEVVASLEEAGYAVCPLQGVQLCHDGYLPEVVAARDKHPRNLRLAIAETEDHPDRPLAWYNLARSALFTSDTDTVIQALAQVARLLAEGRRMGEAPYCGYVLLQRRLWMAQGRASECEALLDEGLARVEGFPEFHYERGLLRRARGAHALAIADFEACLRPSARYHTAPVRPEIAGLWAPAQLAELKGLAPDAIAGGGA